MKIRKLNLAERVLTRPLYENVFSEDYSKFVDYYYTWKIRDNEIYVAEDEAGIHAMVHLNPFSVRYQGKVRQMHYIVAVATQQEYRHQGLMRRLLARAEQDMAESGEPLTFLMPASEQIYLPFGYRFFGWQKRGILETGAQTTVPEQKNARIEAEKTTQHGKTQLVAASVCEGTPGMELSGDVIGCAEERAEMPDMEHDLCCRPVRRKEYDILVRFVNETLSRQYELYVERDFAYYERLSAEQSCQGGAVMGIWSDDTLIGTFCTAKENPEDPAPSLREIILAKEWFSEGEQALRKYVQPYGGCKVEGCPPELTLEAEELVPLMMGKVPGAGVFTQTIEKETVFLNEVV